MTKLFIFTHPQNATEYQATASNVVEAVSKLNERFGDELHREELSPLDIHMLTGTEIHPGLEDFEAKYTPIPNSTPYAGGDPPESCMFETCGKDSEHVRGQDQRTVWTLIEAEGILWITSGLHFVNRLAYFITQQESAGEEEIYLYCD